EPSSFDSFAITATTQNGTILTQTVVGNAGAAGYGFYATPGDSIQSITLSSAVDFAVGEFGIAAAAVAPPNGGGEEGSGGGGEGSVPDTASWTFALALSCVGGSSLVLRKRNV